MIAPALADDLKMNGLFLDLQLGLEMPEFMQRLLTKVFRAHTLLAYDLQWATFIGSLDCV